RRHHRQRQGVQRLGGRGRRQDQGEDRGRFSAITASPPARLHRLPTDKPLKRRRRPPGPSLASSCRGKEGALHETKRTLCALALLERDRALRPAGQAGSTVDGVGGRELPLLPSALRCGDRPDARCRVNSAWIDASTVESSLKNDAARTAAALG